MSARHGRGLFITGTGTGVGKTYVAALIARSLTSRGHRVGVYKPVASGCPSHNGALISEDALALWEAASQPGELARVCPQRFAAPLAPHLAARAEGQQVNAALLRSGLDYWRERSDVLLIEGTGGLLSPVTEHEYAVDLALDLGFPLLVVSANELGTIHSTLATILAAGTFGDSLSMAGVVLNQCNPPPADAASASNFDELSARCGLHVLGQVGWGSQSIDREVDWFEIAGARTMRCAPQPTSIQ